MRHSRHIRHEYLDDDTRVTDRSKGTLLLFNTYRNLPLNWMHALVDPTGDLRGYGNLCTRMWRRGLLNRRTFNGKTNKNETQTYSRTDAGTRWLEQKGLPSDTDYVTTGDEEQLLIDLALAQTELGLRQPHAVVTLHKWPEIKHHPKTPPLPDSPFRFEYGTNPNSGKPFEIIPDGAPYYLKRNSDSVLVLDEVIRTNKKRAVLKKKIRLYKQVEQLIKDRYAFKALMVRFIAADKTTENNIVKWIGEELGECKWMLVGGIVDYIQNPVSTIPVTTDLVDIPYRRAGYLPFSLKYLEEVPDPAIRERNIELIAQSNNKTIQVLKDKQDGWA
jgi:hypothetical protein